MGRYVPALFSIGVLQTPLPSQSRDFIFCRSCTGRAKGFTIVKTHLVKSLCRIRRRLECQLRPRGWQNFQYPQKCDSWGRGRAKRVGVRRGVRKWRLKLRWKRQGAGKAGSNWRKEKYGYSWLDYLTKGRGCRACKKEEKETEAKKESRGSRGKPIKFCGFGWWLNSSGLHLEARAIIIWHQGKETKAECKSWVDSQFKEKF